MTGEVRAAQYLIRSHGAANAETEYCEPETSPPGSAKKRQAQQCESTTGMSGRPASARSRLLKKSRDVDMPETIVYLTAIVLQRARTTDAGVFPDQADYGRYGRQADEQKNGLTA